MQLLPKISGNRTHTVQSSCSFSVAVVVGIRIDIVGVDLTCLINNKFNTRNPYPVFGDEALITLDDGIVKTFDDRIGLCRFRPGLPSETEKTLRSRLCFFFDGLVNEFTIIFLFISLLN
ncbi:MAG: hypothetical protein K9J49_09070 [Candidatus Methylopumilus sp.]|nr:hypothetical protein [Candidatus Methylopumilus sp.]